MHKKSLFLVIKTKIQTKYRKLEQKVQNRSSMRKILDTKSHVIRRRSMHKLAKRG